MKRYLSLATALLIVSSAPVYAMQAGRVELLCHRTANNDVPENTLESLEQAALLGCDVVEMDLRRTLDGKIILNHDGFLERLTDGSGEVETTFYDDLRMRDAGSWMGDRFAGMHVVLFEDALRLARDRDIRLILDIKTKGIGVDVLRILEREGMLHRVQFNGEWDDVKKLYPAATDVGEGTAWVQPGVSAAQVDAYHRQGKAVVANFSANDHEMDLFGMKAAVAAGVDGLNVDYPRLGADAAGKPVEEKLHALEHRAQAGDTDARSQAILELARYRGFPLEPLFVRWLMDENAQVSRAAALALVEARPRTNPTALSGALQSTHADVRANAAWALGAMQAPSSFLLPMLTDSDSAVLQESLIALSHMQGDVPAGVLEPLLAHADPAVRGAAAVALARHQPQAAQKAVPEQLNREITTERAIYAEHERAGGGKFSQPEIDRIVESFRCQMEMLRALHMLDGVVAMHALEAQAFGPTEGFLQPNGIVAAFDLWDRVDAEPGPVMQALASKQVQQADRAEWVLIHAGTGVLPQLRTDLHSEDPAVRRRAMQIVAWQGDTASLSALQAIQAKQGPDAEVAAWAIAKIQSLQPEP
jgi:glycerophosphoryl diester phosphodiesterase